MFLLDDILLSPINGFVWLCRQIEGAAMKETEVTPDMISAELSQLYMLLETEQIEPEEFDTREAELLDLLDELQAEAAANADDEDDDDDDDDEDDDDEFDDEIFDDDDDDDDSEDETDE